MMYMSRVPLNPRRRQAKVLLGSPHAMHAAVLSSFAPGIALDGDDGRVLWRVERSDEHTVWLLIVSPERPELIVVAEQAGWPTQHAGETKEYDGFIDRVVEGQEWGFRLVANPSHLVTDDQGRKKRYAHVTVAKQEKWLLDRASANGFEIRDTEQGALDLVVRDRETRRFNRNGARVTLGTVTYDGRLRVTDADALRRALRAGIGRGKGYGCGLLTLAPLVS